MRLDKTCMILTSLAKLETSSQELEIPTLHVNIIRMSHEHFLKLHDKILRNLDTFCHV